MWYRQQFFSQKEMVNQIMMRHEIGTPSDRKSQKRGVLTVEPPYHAQVLEYPRLDYSPSLPPILTTNQSPVLVWQSNKLALCFSAPLVAETIGCHRSTVPKCTHIISCRLTRLTFVLSTSLPYTTRTSSKHQRITWPAIYKKLVTFILIAD